MIDTNMNILIKEIWQIIIDDLNFVDQFNIRLVSKYFMINHPITNLFDILMIIN